MLCDGQQAASVQYEYDGTWGDKLKKVGSQEIDYDDNGNPVTYLGKPVYWTRGRLLDRFGTTCFSYNSAGLRTEKCVKGVATKYALSGSTLLSETTNGSTTIYYNTTDGVIGFNKNNADYFYRKNLQGDVVALYNSSGALQAKYVYDAWGNHKIYNASNTLIYDSENPANYASYANEIGNVNPYRYRGYYFDSDTGLYYLQTRTTTL